MGSTQNHGEYIQWMAVKLMISVQPLNQLYLHWLVMQSTMASGFGGQHIMIFPELDMADPFASEDFTSYRIDIKILENNILKALI